MEDEVITEFAEVLKRNPQVSRVWFWYDETEGVTEVFIDQETNEHGVNYNV